LLADVGAAVAAEAAASKAPGGRAVLAIATAPPRTANAANRFVDFTGLLLPTRLPVASAKDDGFVRASLPSKLASF
jgi:hypothetical protein